MRYQNWVVPVPCKDIQLAGTAQMSGSEKRGGRRVDRNLKFKIFFTEDRRSGGRGDTQAVDQLPTGNHLCL